MYMGMDGWAALSCEATTPMDGWMDGWIAMNGTYFDSRRKEEEEVAQEEKGAFMIEFAFSGGEKNRPFFLFWLAALTKEAVA